VLISRGVGRVLDTGPGDHLIMLAALAIFNTMSMSVLERTGEIGVMRAMGMSGPRALGLFLVESIFIGLLGSAGGVLLGSAGAWYLETYGVTWGRSWSPRWAPASR